MAFLEWRYVGHVFRREIQKKFGSAAESHDGDLVRNAAGQRFDERSEVVVAIEVPGGSASGLDGNDESQGSSRCLSLLRG